jgi:hypothetical protein
MSYPEDEVVEKFNSWIVVAKANLGCVIAAESKTATSLAPGWVGFQLLFALKTVPVLAQTLLLA